MATSERLSVFGIRHHGPGSARSLRAALEVYQPDAVLVEGPPDANDLIPYAAQDGMKPPLALLVYVPEEPRRAVFYPFAKFSPEWIALRHGLARGVLVRFMDLPQYHRLAIEPAQEERNEADAVSPAAQTPDEAAADSDLWQDPLGRLARVAGFDDGERWWDHLVESRRDATGAVFEAIADAMAVLREDHVPASPARDEPCEQQREAYMRKTIRAALAEGCERVAVVCGAWHAPALRDACRKGSAAADAALLKGLPKVKTAAAWTPWSYDRLSYRSGYGAGVASPAYYDLLWTHQQQVAIHWTTRAARLIREQDLDASSAHVIESVRLAETLAAMRGRPQPGLDELVESAFAVLCAGNEAPMQLVRRKLIVGDRLGSVPDDAPATPLQQELKALQKRLRLAVSADEHDYDLDLRKALDLERSRLLHRLNLLSIAWGERREARGGKGTFHELWRLAWRPEFIVSLIAAGRWGNTIESAAAAFTAERARGADGLDVLIGLLDHALLADLPDAVALLIGAIQRHAALGGDIPQLMHALPPLARIARYGNVRQTDTATVLNVVDGLLTRICIGLFAAASTLDDEAARRMLACVNGVHEAVILLQNEAQRRQWLATIARLADQPGLHALLAGRAARLMHDTGSWPQEDVGRRVSLALSVGNDPLQAAAWVEGFLGGSGALLIHDEPMWQMVDDWLCGLSEAHFTLALPLVRRTFATFPVAERRQLGERVTRSGRGAALPVVAANFDYSTADAVLPLLAKVLGVADERAGSSQ